MAYVTPRVWVFSESITAAKLNEISSTLNYLASPPSCRAYKTSSPSINNATWTTVSFEQNRHDNASIHSPGGSSFVAVMAGVWELKSCFEFATNGTGSRGVRCLNGATEIGKVEGPAQSTTARNMNLAVPDIKCNLGDSLTWQVIQNSGAGLALNAQTDYASVASARWAGFGT